MLNNNYPVSQNKIDPIGLFSGKMGIAFYKLHYARYYPDKDYKARALSIINENKKNIHWGTTFRYADGLAGIGSAFSYLLREGFIKTSDTDFFSDIDSYFFKKIYAYKHIDLSRDSGLVGIGYYLLNRIMDMPDINDIYSVKLRYWLLLVQDIIFAYLGMNGFAYPVMKSDALTDSVIGDVKRFLCRMMKSGLCPELTQKALALTNKNGFGEQTVFARLEEAYNNKNMKEFRSLLEKIVGLPEDSPAKRLAILQLQKTTLPAWWELF